jgi:hypothetical protein
MLTVEFWPQLANLQMRIKTKTVKKNIFLLLSISLINGNIVHAQKATKNKTITVSNPLTIDRAFETIELSKKAICLKDSDDIQKYALKELGTNEIIESQFVDENGDGSFDVLLFQPKIPASSNKKFELILADNTQKKESIVSCYSRFVPERTDDYAWENNRVAFRTYGPVAQKMIEDKIKGGTLSSGMDAWLKRVDYPIINKWYEKATSGTGSYHEDTGEGLDNFHVGASRGIGGITVKVDSTFYVSKNFTTWKTITTGPIRTSFILTYADWDAKGNKITETKKISLDYGSNLSKFEVTITGTKTISAGITLHDKKGKIGTNLKNGWISHWEPLQDSELGTGIVTPKNTMIGFENYITSKADLSNLFGILKVKNNKVIYYAGFGWKKAGLYTNKEDWEKYLNEFSLKLNNPLKVKIH